jgi:HSP20 family molecular chaperone IbpA
MSQQLDERRARGRERRTPFTEIEPLENIEAKLADGLLRIRVPKAERAERRRIEVAAS